MIGPKPRHPVAAPYPKPTQSIGQAPNPPGQLRVGERAIASHQRHLVWGDPGSTLNPRANPEVGRSGWHGRHGQGYPQPTPCRQEAPATQTPNGSSASPRQSFWRTSKRTRIGMQVSALILTCGRSTLFGHEPDHLTAARTGPEREDDQRLRWSSAWWSPPPESNRRPHPYHGTTRNRCAKRRFPGSRPTVRVEVIGSLSAKLCALLLLASP